MTERTVFGRKLSVSEMFIQQSFRKSLSLCMFEQHTNGNFSWFLIFQLLR